MHPLGGAKAGVGGAKGKVGGAISFSHPLPVEFQVRSKLFMPRAWKYYFFKLQLLTLPPFNMAGSGIPRIFFKKGNISELTLPRFKPLAKLAGDNGNYSPMDLTGFPT